jgi:hypothetical protein
MCSALTFMEEPIPITLPTITDSGTTVVRWGGDATSRYNWQAGTYNAANDWYFGDYGYTEIGDSSSTQFITDVKAAGSNPLMTMVMLGWVAKMSPTAVRTVFRSRSTERNAP